MSKKDEPSKTIFVRQFPADVKLREISNLFRAFDGFVSARISKNQGQKDKRVSAEVDFETIEQATLAVESMNEYLFDTEDNNSHLEVSFSPRKVVVAKETNKRKRPFSESENNNNQLLGVPFTSTNPPLPPPNANYPPQNPFPQNPYQNPYPPQNYPNNSSYSSYQPQPLNQSSSSYPPQSRPAYPQGNLANLYNPSNYLPPSQQTQYSTPQNTPPYYPNQNATPSYASPASTPAPTPPVPSYYNNPQQRSIPPPVPPPMFPPPSMQFGLGRYMSGGGGIQYPPPQPCDTLFITLTHFDTNSLSTLPPPILSDTENISLEDSENPLLIHLLPLIKNLNGFSRAKTESKKRPGGRRAIGVFVEFASVVPATEARLRLNGMKTAFSKDGLLVNFAKFPMRSMAGGGGGGGSSGSNGGGGGGGVGKGKGGGTGAGADVENRAGQDRNDAAAATATSVTVGETKDDGAGADGKGKE